MTIKPQATNEPTYQRRFFVAIGTNIDEGTGRNVCGGGGETSVFFVAKTNIYLF